MPPKKSIVIFTQPECPPCRWAKSYLAGKGFEFQERDISLDPQAVDELVSTYNSRSTPTLVIDGHVMIGFDPEQLEQILNE